jgi:diguanylate cyclase (GGDEF)-like protein
MSHFSQAVAKAGDIFNMGASAPGARLLIVDDLADNRAILSRRFQRRGFEIVEADCGREALRLVAEQEFDVVLLDVMMPDLDGTSVLREIRQTFSPKLLPVIMVTAKSQSEDVVEALQIGANDYVTKPVDFAVALARVNNQVESRRAELALRKQNEKLLDAKADLETRISERSARLMEANNAIREEVARRLASEDQIAFLAHHDVLTGLANRFTFDSKLSELRQVARDCGSQISVLFIDLDGFKNVNDTLGHAIGDALLQEVAQRLTNVVGSKDFCARIGGDEFAIIHASEDAHATAGRLSQDLIDTISGCHSIDGNEIYIGASIGIAVVSGGDSEASELLKHADLAMYRAKADGRGVYRFFEAEMGRQAELRRTLELDLRRAVERGEFQLYYQPIVDLKQNKVAGVEALMRWNHEERGFVSPVEFIALAEETGLIVQLGAWALRRACKDAVRWPSHMKVAVNLSPVQFRNANLVSIVDEALTMSGLDPSRLELEITESVLLGSNSQNLATLNRLRQRGVRISLDDFGTGYSGIGYFRAFQFDKVKIDQSFVRDMRTHPESRAIIKAAVGLGANLGICTTAEGVESVEQLEYLLGEGCTEVQGFLFSTPQPRDDLIATVERIESLQPQPVRCPT